MLAEKKGRTQTLLWIAVAIAAWSQLPHFVEGQRAIVNLGKRLKRPFGRSTNASLQQGEEAEMILEGETTFYGYTKFQILGTVALGLLLLLFWFVPFAKPGCKESEEVEEKEDDIVVEEDHVVPMGGMDHVDLSFEGLKLVLENGGKTREILDGSIRGRAKPGRMLAILGPSGAGKSTVIHALAGRVKDNPRLKLYGNRYINGHPLSGDSMVPAAFVEQDVSFFPHMTVRETLNFRVELKLGPKLSKKARDKMVTDLMSQLGLTKSADTPVGDAKVRGISGGERKRLSIAVEMIAQPNMIFLDEPTSGLDSTAATNLVTTLRNLADQGKTVVAVIHQPSQHVFAKFDDLILVSEGKLMYSGERTGVRSYLEKHGCPAPPEMGSAEHVLDCISLLPIEDETEEEAHGRVHRLAAEAAKKHIDLGPISGEGDHGVTRFVSKSGHGPRANLLVQFRLLFTRAIREVARGKAALILKIVQQVTTAFIYGGIYSLGTNQASIQDRIGLLSLIAIGTTNIAIGQTIRSFPREKTIVSNEIASKMYRTLPYFIGKAISELPVVAFLNGLFGVLVYRLTGLNRAVGRFRNFLGLLIMHGFVSESTGLVMGAIAPNTDVALAMFPAVIVLNIIFDGKNISEENTPRILRWIPKVGLIRWGFEGLCVNEFEGLTFDKSGPRRGPVAATGADALARFGLGDRSLSDVVRAQVAIGAGCWILSYLGLTLSRQKFLIMRKPEETSA